MVPEIIMEIGMVEVEGVWRIFKKRWEEEEVEVESVRSIVPGVGTGFGCALSATCISRSFHNRFGLWCPTSLLAAVEITGVSCSSLMSKCSVDVLFFTLA